MTLKLYSNNTKHIGEYFAEIYVAQCYGRRCNDHVRLHSPTFGRVKDVYDLHRSEAALEKFIAFYGPTTVGVCAQGWHVYNNPKYVLNGKGGQADI